MSCLVLLGLVFCAGSALAATPSFKQERDNQASSGNTSRVTFSSGTTAGNLIAVYLIWDSTGFASVSDSLGNTYSAAVTPTRWSNGKYSAQIFYAINVGSGTDTVTATFATKLNQFGIVYAHEYSGIRRTAPVDVTAAASGTSGSLSSGSATTTNDFDLLFAGGVSANVVTGAGAGYAARSFAHGNITEDRMVSSKGSYSATASNSGGAWAMQMVAFKGVAGGDTTPPTVPAGLSPTVLSASQINLSWTASTDPDNSSSQVSYSVFRNGTLVNTTAAGAISWTDSGLAPSTTYSYKVSARDPAGNSSAQSTAVQATTPPATDTSSPTVPTNLSVTGTTTSTVSLAWSPSTDNVGVAGYKIYRGAVQAGVSGGTSYTDSGLAGATTYSYTVSAYDAAGNTSAQSAPVSATTLTPDTQAPTVSITAPANNQSVSGATTIAANATDNVGVVGVQLQIDGGNLGAEILSPPYSTNWNTTQAANGSHVLTAIARDAAGNQTTSSAVTVNVSNTLLRPYVTNFPGTENPISESGNWVNGKKTGLDWGDVRTTPGLAFGTNNGGYADPTALVTGTWGPDQMAQATVYSVNQNDGAYEEVELRLRSVITAHSNRGYEINFRCSKTGNAYSQVVRWNGPLGDFTYLWASSGSQYGVTSGDVVKATMIGNLITVYINGVQKGQVSDDTFTTGSPGMGFYLSGAGNNSDYGFTSFMASDVTNDTNPPSIPTNLSATPVSVSQIDLSWTPSTDNVAVAGYAVFRDGNQIATSASPSFSDQTVVPGTQYTYNISAYDAAGNTSAQSAPVIAQTSSDPDITPPSVPANVLSSNITSTSVTLSWTASTDNVAVAGYRVFRNGTQIATTTAIRYNDTGLTPSTTYNYTVEAVDTSNNASAESQPLMVTTSVAVLTPPSLVQVNQNQISSGTSTAVTFNTPTVVGNTAVVYVIWSNAGTVTVADSAGNTFANIGAPVTWGSGYSAQVFYGAVNTGGSDTVTATFHTTVASFGVVYAHEYAGISRINPVDVTTSASGSSTQLNSGTATTTSANDLIFGAGVSDNVVTAAGSGFAQRDMAFGNITEDRVGGSIGSYAATATHNGSKWGMQLVAFRGGQ